MGKSVFILVGGEVEIDTINYSRRVHIHVRVSNLNYSFSERTICNLTLHPTSANL